MGNATVWLKIFIAFVFSTGAVVFSIVSFATDHWNVYTVDRDSIKNLINTKTVLSERNNLNESLYKDKAYKTRYRGLMFTCYTADNKEFDCQPESGYELSPNPETVKYGLEYKLRIHLLRLWFALHLLAMVLFVVGFVYASWSSCQKRRKLFWITAALYFFGSLVNAFAMADFQVVDYLEKVKIVDDSIFYANAKSDVELNGSIDYVYGYSYMLSWIGLAMGLLAAIMFMSISSHYNSEGLKSDRSDRRPLNKNKRHWCRRNKRHHPYNHAPEGKEYIMEKYYNNLPTMGAVTTSPYVVYDPLAYDYGRPEEMEITTDREAYRTAQQFMYSHYANPELYEGAYY